MTRVVILGGQIPSHSGRIGFTILRIIGIELNDIQGPIGFSALEYLNQAGIEIRIGHFIVFDGRRIINRLHVNREIQVGTKNTIRDRENEIAIPVLIAIVLSKDFELAVARIP